MRDDYDKEMSHSYFGFVLWVKAGIQPHTDVEIIIKSTYLFLFLVGNFLLESIRKFQCSRENMLAQLSGQHCSYYFLLRTSCRSQSKKPEGIVCSL